jgi:hypothetical protein
MGKPYHLMTPAEKIAARIAANKEIEQRAKVASPMKEFSKIGHAFLDSLPDMDKGTEADSLLKLGRIAKKDSKK